ncbi:ribokinase [Pelosinus sp. sgz500959]|uniref:ribokinase n=1 Tax=Pelosinus sp. sgz500959 TaxID=3242472 RepID=UPI00366FD375
MITKKTVLVVGSLNMDLVATAQRLPQRGETIFGKEFATFPGGKGANQAVAAGKLDAIVHMVGCIGHDGFGSELMGSLEANQVHTNFIRQVDASTGTALITVADDGANTIVVVGGANMECTSIDVDRALESLLEPGILLVQNEVSRETVEYAIEAAKARGWMVILNPAPARQIQKKLMSCVDIIMPNETEMALLTDCPVETLDEIVCAAGILLESGVKNVIVTMGSKGAVCCNELGYQQIKPYSVNAVDTTAAGDAYTGGLATALAEGKTLLESMDFAAAVAGISVTRRGAQPSLPWRAEVEEFMSKEGIDR